MYLLTFGKMKGKVKTPEGSQNQFFETLNENELYYFANFNLNQFCKEMCYLFIILQTWAD